MGICRVKEYDCWLQERGANSFSAQTVDALSVICANINGDIATNAVNELREGLLKRFGIQSKCVISSDAPCITARVNGASDIGAEGFKIKSENGGVVIEGADERGLLYGVYYFMRELSLGADISTMDITEVPAGAIRMINHWDNIDGSIERGYAGRSVFFSDSKLSYDPVRIKDYARLLASVGINLLSINNVNVRFEAKRLITEDHLPRIAELAAVFRPFGVRLVLSINFSAPYSYGDLDTADPLDPGVAQWWKDRADLVYKYIPDLAGFLVKADSEGEPGPFQYGRDHTDGANMLAKALKPHGGDVIWRCFVYNSTQDWRDHTQDRPCAAYSHFLPLDGRFDDNVILQIKNGPLDFQVYEPVSPLFGALSKTRHIMEFQVTQEYTGQQIDVCYLPFMWQDVMRFDTKHGENATIAAMIGGRIEGIAGVGNVGLDMNWTGHTLAQANFYGYGRMAWNPNLSAAEIAAEWVALTFGESAVNKKVENILMKSYPVFAKYNCPFGIGFMVSINGHYGPSIEGYEYSRWGTYHRAGYDAIGIDRTAAGTGFAAQFTPENEKFFTDLATCPENVLLFFHRVRYDYIMHNGQTLLQNIYDTHFEGYDGVLDMMSEWKTLESALSKDVYESVLARFERQLDNAREWRDQINTYFMRRTGIGDAKGRKIYD